MNARAPVLLSWIAVNNDPFERDREGHQTRDAQGGPVLGPTLTLLFDPKSPYKGQIKDVVLLSRRLDGDVRTREGLALEKTIAEIGRHDRSIQIFREFWQGEDPTDHGAIFTFLKATLPKIRESFAGRELIVHVSPGTPSMQTIWVLMGETGFIKQPFRLVKSYRKTDRRDRTLVVPVEVGLETFYKAYITSHPAQLSSEEQEVTWDRQRFQSSRMKSLFDEARRFACLNVPVLILGERGTGKTTLANWIRGHSCFRVRERDGSWPAVACGQYTPETMRAELFGYVKGAFTGAGEDKSGLLEAANGDTLFLDEVGDVSRDLQRLLIKALEEKRYYRLGEDTPRTSRFRLITATNLPEELLRERLDADFLDRISPLTLRLPSLREIREELSWLWRDIYLTAAKRAEVESSSTRLGDVAHDHVVEGLKRNPLWGNMRDLFRVAYRILAVRSDPECSLSEDDAVAYGLETLNRTDAAGSDTSRAIARAFANKAPLDAIFDDVGTIQTKMLDIELKTWLADELYRMGGGRGCNPADLCDVSDRTLRNWRSGKN